MSKYTLLKQALAKKLAEICEHCGMENCDCPECKEKTAQDSKQTPEENLKTIPEFVQSSAIMSPLGALLGAGLGAGAFRLFAPEQRRTLLNYLLVGGLGGLAGGYTGNVAAKQIKDVAENPDRINNPGKTPAEIAEGIRAEGEAILNEEKERQGQKDKNK